MARRRALVVDDSKTARISLRNMLEQQDIDVDTLESAPAALDYLVNTTPDVIFMDHMMPDMDGFEAVEAIKGNPDTATIPIMMYTSKEGDLYVSQARALGAIGILPKHVEPAELFEVLNSLGLARERRSKPRQKSGVVLLDNAPEVALSADAGDIRDIAYAAAEAVSSNESANRQLGTLLENFHSETTARIHELRTEVQEMSAAAASARKGSGLLLPLTALLVILMAIVWLYNQQQETDNRLTAAQQRISILADRQHPQANNPGNTATRQVTSARQPDSSNQHLQLLYSSIAWATNLGSAYDMREIAFSDRRLAVIQELLTRLTALGFRGTVQLESHVGDFCLSGDDANGYAEADGDIPAAECSLIGHPLYQLSSLGERQSIGFANFISSSPLVNNDAIRIELINYQNSRPRLPYPSRHAGVTAREWNEIAATNNRVEVSLIPALN